MCDGARGEGDYKLDGTAGAAIASNLLAVRPRSPLSWLRYAVRSAALTGGLLRQRVSVRVRVRMGMRVRVRMHACGRGGRRMRVSGVRDLVSRGTSDRRTAHRGATSLLLHGRGPSARHRAAESASRAASQRERRWQRSGGHGWRRSGRRRVRGRRQIRWRGCCGAGSGRSGGASDGGRRRVHERSLSDGVAGVEMRANVRFSHFGTAKQNRTRKQQRRTREQRVLHRARAIQGRRKQVAAITDGVVNTLTASLLSAHTPRMKAFLSFSSIMLWSS